MTLFVEEWSLGIAINKPLVNKEEVLKVLYMLHIEQFVTHDLLISKVAVKDV
jgi:hypothetical protein